MRPRLFLSTELGAALRQRGVAIVAVIALHALLLLLLLRIAPPPDGRAIARRVPILVDLLPDPQPEPSPAESPKAAQAPRPPSPAERDVAPPRPIAPSPVPTPPSSSVWSQIIPMTREQLAAADISGIRSSPSAASEGSGAAAPADDEVEGRAPNGERLYRAEWYRHPTQAQLATYLPATVPANGWGMIVCQTAPRYRVENCEEVGQYPPGSGLARAVREAAWQFQVLPPRVGGRPQIGAWVRIRIEYSELVKR